MVELVKGNTGASRKISKLAGKDNNAIPESVKPKVRSKVVVVQQGHRIDANVKEKSTRSRSIKPLARFSEGSGMFELKTKRTRKPVGFMQSCNEIS